jgi:hypothetical protein
MTMSTTRRLATLFAALIASACFALAVQGGKWWTVGEHSVGTTSSERCFDGNCERTSLDWTSGGDVWMRAGIATWVAGMIAALVFVALAGSLAAKATGRLAASVALVATMTAIAAAAVFHQYRPDVQGLAVGRGSYLFAAALLAGLGSAISTLRAPRS